MSFDGLNYGDSEGLDCFGFEDFEEPPKKIPKCEILWRGDPDETFSDWTIEIVTMKPVLKIVLVGDEESVDDLEKSVATYYVHKANLSYGKRSSRYFSRLIRQASLSGNFKEGETSVSRIDLDPLAAESFPAFLDFLYTERSLEICNETASALSWLGDYFEVPLLLSEAQEFIRQNMSVNNLGNYYRHSTKFQVDSIILEVQTYTSEHILEINPDDEILVVASPGFWMDCLTTASSDWLGDIPNEFSQHVSGIVAKISKLHLEKLNRKSFDDLTAKSIIPVIDCFHALSLCEADDLLNSKERTASGECNSDSESLQKRCADALADKWRDLAVNWDGELEGDTMELLESRQPKFLVDLLLKSLNYAEEDYVSSDKQVASLKKKLSNAKKQTNTNQKTAETRSRELDETKLQLESSRNEVSRLQQDLDETKRQLAEAKSVVSRFSFVSFNPNATLVWTSPAPYPADLANYGKVGVCDGSYVFDRNGARIQLYMFR